MSAGSKATDANRIDDAVSTGSKVTGANRIDGAVGRWVRDTPGGKPRQWITRARQDPSLRSG